MNLPARNLLSDSLEPRTRLFALLLRDPLVRQKTERDLRWRHVDAICLRDDGVVEKYLGGLQFGQKRVFELAPAVTALGPLRPLGCARGGAELVEGPRSLAVARLQFAASRGGCRRCHKCC